LCELSEKDKFLLEGIAPSEEEDEADSWRVPDSNRVNIQNTTIIGNHAESMLLPQSVP